MRLSHSPFWPRLAGAHPNLAASSKQPAATSKQTSATTTTEARSQSRPTFLLPARAKFADSGLEAAAAAVAVASAVA